MSSNPLKYSASLPSPRFLSRSASISPLPDSLLPIARLIAKLFPVPEFEFGSIAVDKEFEPEPFDTGGDSDFDSFAGELRAEFSPSVDPGTTGDGVSKTFNMSSRGIISLSEK